MLVHDGTWIGHVIHCKKFCQHIRDSWRGILLAVGGAFLYLLVMPIDTVTNSKNIYASIFAFMQYFLKYFLYSSFEMK